ncbi:hypothetical protein MNBD_GAMMA26-1340 [hydrothermal vent metagenome]|uniref:Cyclic nucleotide-binding domain-containing protein n=1 Tax=hydrothermal vent metagenome TaxID=652676 RepID=A0A3B1BG96_9ZZZZ
MNDSSNIESLKRSDITDGLSDEQCQVLADVIEIHNLKDGDVLISEGQTDSHLYIIDQGRIEVARAVQGGNWVTLAILRDGDFAGEMGFIDGSVHSATLRSMGDSRILSLSRDTLESLIDTNPHLVYKLMQTIIRVVHKILTRMNQQYVEMNNYISKQHGRY